MGSAVQPGQPLIPGGDQLAPVIYRPPGPVEDQVRVPQLAQAGVAAFADADREHDSPPRGESAQPLGLGSRNHDRLAHQPLMEPVLVRRCQHAVPDREPGHERLAEREQPGSAAGRLGDQGIDLVQGRGQIEKRRRCLHRGDADRGQHQTRHGATPSCQPMPTANARCLPVKDAPPPPVKAGGLNRRGASGGRGRATRIGAVRSLDSTEVRGWAKTQGTEVEDRRPVLTELGVKAKAATAH